MKQFLALFNWKNNPENIFVIAVPLYIVGMLFIIIFAILQAFHKDFGYLIVFMLCSPLIILVNMELITIINIIAKRR